MDDKYNIYEALELLKEKYILFANINGIKCYFINKAKLIWIIHGNARYKLNERDFLTLYKDINFYIDAHVNDVEIDIEKDKEYYSWKQ